MISPWYATRMDGKVMYSDWLDWADKRELNSVMAVPLLAEYSEDKSCGEQQQQKYRYYSLDFPTKLTMQDKQHIIDMYGERLG